MVTMSNTRGEFGTRHDPPAMSRLAALLTTSGAKDIVESPSIDLIEDPVADAPADGTGGES